MYLFVLFCVWLCSKSLCRTITGKIRNITKMAQSPSMSIPSTSTQKISSFFANMASVNTLVCASPHLNRNTPNGSDSDRDCSQCCTSGFRKNSIRTTSKFVWNTGSLSCLFRKSVIVCHSLYNIYWYIWKIKLYEVGTYSGFLGWILFSAIYFKLIITLINYIPTRQIR